MTLIEPRLAKVVPSRKLTVPPTLLAMSTTSRSGLATVRPKVLTGTVTAAFDATAVSTTPAARAVAVPAATNAVRKRFRGIGGAPSNHYRQSPTRPHRRDAHRQRGHLPPRASAGGGPSSSPSPRDAGRAAGAETGG